ncbi:MAG TPA: type II secretion system protein GspM [Sphingomonas sp.]|jgi:general secretion pathway protein M|uniref:type II secretion system protein GspM n=1 Tax=Sphingomonas sp. TaxID=28214 RepID=UPI002ED8DC83
MAIPFEPHVARVRSWWTARSTRERALLAALGAVAVIALLLVLVVKPLQAARGQALADIRTYETLSAGLTAAGSSARPAAPGRSGPVAQILTTTAAGFGLTVQRVEPEGGQTRVVMDGVPYDAVMRWLADLETGGGVTIAEVRLDRADAAGQVNVQVVVQGS